MAEAARRALSDRLDWLGTDFGRSASVGGRLTPAYAKKLMTGFSWTSHLLLSRRRTNKNLSVNSTPVRLLLWRMEAASPLPVR